MRIFALFLAFIASALAQDGPFPRDKTVDAAFRYKDGKLYLISGDEFMAIGDDNFEAYIRQRTGSKEVPASLAIQAAVAWPCLEKVYLYGQDASYCVDIKGDTTHKEAYAKHREFLQGGGPDAVSYKDGYFFLFKGCEYASQSKTLFHFGEARNVTDLGLPCDLDAAWTSPDYKTMTVLKGDQIWTLTGNDKAVGHSNFADTYKIWSWQLKPTTDDRFPL